MDCKSWCWFCAHWFQDDPEVYDFRRMVGECRRYPPVVPAEGATEWPVTMEFQFCGEFKEMPGIAPYGVVPEWEAVPGIGTKLSRAATTILSRGLRTPEELQRWNKTGQVTITKLDSVLPKGMSLQERDNGVRDVCWCARMVGIHIDGDPIRACPGPLVNDNP